MLTEAGAYGWQHLGWQNDFYPQELPKDWQFSFYSQQFRTVILPNTDLRKSFTAITENQMPEWLDDLYPEFSLFIELTPTCLSDLRLIQTVQQLLASIEYDVAGFVLTIANQSPPEHFDKQLTDWFTIFNLPMHFNLSPAVLEQWQPLVARFDLIYWCWQQQDNWSVDCQLMIIDTTHETLELRQLGQLIKQFKQQGSKHDITFVFIKGEPPPAAVLAKTQTLLALF